jgi:hypothetical protein
VDLKRYIFFLKIKNKKQKTKNLTLEEFLFVWILAVSSWCRLFGGLAAEETSTAYSGITSA